MKNKEKISYEEPMLDISVFSAADVIATSSDWSGGGDNVDSNGWT